MSMPVFGFVGWSGSGKTTLIERLLPELIACGLRVSVIKQAHREFDIDQPGKDSWRHRQAGAREVLLSGARRWALVHEFGEAPEPSLATCLHTLAPCDLVLVEGFRLETIPKIEVHRPALGRDVLASDNPYVVAIACDAPVVSDLPQLDLNDVPAVADFVLARVGLPRRGGVDGPATR